MIGHAALGRREQLLARVGVRAERELLLEHDRAVQREREAPDAGHTDHVLARDLGRDRRAQVDRPRLAEPDELARLALLGAVERSRLTFATGSRVCAFTPGAKLISACGSAARSPSSGETV